MNLWSYDLFFLISRAFLFVATAVFAVALVAGWARRVTEPEDGPRDD